MDTDLTENDLLEICSSLSNEILILNEYFVYKDDDYLTKYGSALNDRINTLSRLYRYFGKLADNYEEKNGK